MISTKECKWLKLEEKKPNISQYCYVTDGKNKAIGIWMDEFILMKGTVKKIKKWKPFFTN